MKIIIGLEICLSLTCRRIGCSMHGVMGDTKQARRIQLAVDQFQIVETVQVKTDDEEGNT